MRNFIQPGRSIDVIAPAGGVVSGAVVKVGNIVGVANCDADAGAEVDVDVEGVFELAKTPADNLAQGAVAKVDAAGVVGAAGNVAIGWIVKAAGSGPSTVWVRLTPGIPAGATVMAASEKPAPEEQPKRKAG